MPKPTSHRQLLWATTAASCLLLGACQAPPAPFLPAVELTESEDPLQLAIDNSGSTENHRDYFVLTDPAGTRFYTRDGAFKLDGARTLVHAASGLRLVPRVTFPDGISDIHIREDGLVLIRYPGFYEQLDVEVITTARFPHPEALVALPHGLFLASPLSGPPASGRPATRGFGQLRQGAKEVPAAPPLAP